MNGQLNVTPITDKQPQPACKFEINAIIDGFPVAISGEGKASDLKLIVDKLKSIGATPPANLATQVAKSSAAETECPDHGRAKPSKFGGLYCTASLPSGGHCKWTSKV